MDFDESWPMPTERMEVAKKVAQADSFLSDQMRPMVKVTCWCVDETLEPAEECESCSGDGWHYATLYPHSLTAARLRLADAAEALDKAERAWDAVGRQLEDCPQAFAWFRASNKYDAEMAALRAKRAGG